MDKLLTRDQFREAVFTRDGHKCVFCGVPAVDAHHILDRALWPDGGYYLNNGASVCDSCHMKCETTEYSVEQVRAAALIKTVVLPPQLDKSQAYDKWANPILANGLRLRGELYDRESVQKLLRDVVFTNLVKYPRTPHLPWSPGIDEDDILADPKQFTGRHVVVTEKMDGENTSLYNDHIHARSLDSQHHLSRDWVKSFWGERRYDIPDGWRVCGENIYAKHSIFYTSLPSYFMGFSVWNERNECLSWDNTLVWFKLLNITPVPTLYVGEYNEATIRQLEHTLSRTEHEGYVVRVSDAFPYGLFTSSVAKYVRKGHVTTSEHWMSGPVVPNGLKRE